MSLTTILVCLTTSDHADTLMKAAVPLARKHNAHLIGIHTVEALIVYPSIAIHVPETSFTLFHESQKAESDAVAAIFDKHVKAETFPYEFRLLRAESSSAADRLVESARAADLVFMAHEDKGIDRYDQRHIQSKVIRQSGRPVIVVPLDYDGPVVGSNIVLGWSDTRETARAAHDLLTVADEAANVTVLRVDKSGQDPMRDYDGIDIADTLARHGMKTTLEHREPAGEAVASVLNQVAFEKGADLIVTGAFGHSKAYDFVIGATTYAMLKDADLPVMFSK
ncbi:Nucleotide-binding universal stress protein, UspA family [Cognatiyoonia koreensis]|uniref:Nucleotide-binding universal stress protein, UspA family n=1 Tax=Cognatiyoonia koreensis TaxID=364200 RepID=A0A1I0QHS0_9RHOB|nr:universal stress protein [Cognatiyoonia koreensis]SEW26689.1 Nucleotide-binding universal stress protein, UspA family [Cognatiyoonia koreensis]